MSHITSNFTRQQNQRVIRKGSLSKQVAQKIAESMGAPKVKHDIDHKTGEPMIVEIPSGVTAKAGSHVTNGQTRHVVHYSKGAHSGWETLS